MKNKLSLITILGLLVISGCANNADNSMFGNDPAMHKAETQLASAATSVQDSLSELAAIQKAVYPAAKLPGLPDANKLGMGQMASIDWTGPIEPLVKNIANVTYYKVHVLGKAPAIPIIVSISKQRAPIATILRNAAYQCGDRANIVVYPKSRIIELRYARM